MLARFSTAEAARNACTKMAKARHGVSKETTTGVHHFKEMVAKGELLFHLSTATIA